jgi:hypothetical protein
MSTLVIWHLGREQTRLIDRARRYLVVPHDSIRNCNSVIVLAEGRRLVNNTRTRSIGNVCISYNSERPVLVLHCVS